jgi:hypothetical protein
MPRDRSVSILGMTLPIPGWTVTGIGILVLVAIAAVIYRHVTDNPAMLLTIKEVNQRLSTEVEEYGLHAMEAPTKHELLEDADGALGLRVYADHCVLIQRRTARGVRTRLVMDLARESIRATRRVDPPSGGLLPVAHAQGGCNRGCLNPHPNAFRWWYGARQGDWVEVWRQWPEGCQHVQLFHPPSNSWDTNRDGTPKVRWTCCIH